MKVFTYIAARWYQVRSERAYRRHIELQTKAEKFFARIGGAQ